MPLLIIDDVGLRKLQLIAAEGLREVIIRRYERASTSITGFSRDFQFAHRK